VLLNHHVKSTTYTVSSFADLVDAELSLTRTHFLLTLQLVMYALAFCHWSI